MSAEISKLVFNVVSQFLKIKENDVVSVSVEIFDKINPLLEVPVMEELAVAIRKRMAFPTLEVTTQNLQKRFFSELSEDALGLVPKYYIKWISEISAFVEIGWKALGNHFEEEKAPSKIFFEAVYTVLEEIYKQKKKMVFLNFPSQELSDYVQIPLKTLFKNYFSAANCNYKRLLEKTRYIEDKLKYNEKITIKSGDKQLKFLTNPNKVESFSGSEMALITLPTGKVEVPIKKSFIKGDFFAEMVYYKHMILNDVTILFENGYAKKVTVENGKSSDIFNFKNNLIGAKGECFLSIGTNEAAENFSNFYSYDRVINNTVSLKFFDPRDNPIILLSKSSKIKHITEG